MGTRYRGSPETTSALDAYIKLMRASETVTARIHTILPKDLTISQFGTLEILYHCGPLCPSELAGKLLKSGGNMTLVIKNLERDGFVRRVRSTQDKRYVTIELTPQGREFISKLFPRVAESIREQFSVLTREDQAALSRLCKALGLGATAIASI